MNFWGAAQFILQLIVPSTDDNPKKQYRWRLCVALFLIVGTLGMAVHIALVCGYLPKLFPGFATRDKVEQMLIRQIEGDIIRYRTQQCQAKDSTLREFILGRLQDSLEAYRTETGRDYRIPGCDEV